MYKLFLYRRVRELEGRGIIVSSIRETKARSLDSLSDLTNIDFDMDFSQYDKERLVSKYYVFQLIISKIFFKFLICV